MESRGEKAARVGRNVLFTVGALGLISMLVAIPASVFAVGGVVGGTIFEVARGSIRAKYEAH